MAAVELQEVWKTYGPVVAVQGVSLSLQAGEFFTLLGASGSGKTSLLRLIGGFERADRGQIRLDGEDVTGRPAYQRPVHTVFQDYALFPHLNVAENVGFALRLRGVPRTAVQARVATALEMVQLQGLEQRLPDQLSGGQCQRVALARALVDRPAVLLLDEPLSALDAQIRVGLRAELKRLQRQTGITFIYVTHDQEEALALSDRIAVLRGGQVLQCDTPAAVYERPADLFVAEFIGQANFFAGTLLDVQGHQGRVAAAGQTLVGTLAVPLPPGTPVRLMVRPENLCLQAGPDASRLQGRVRQIQYLGYATQYRLEAEGHMLQALELRRPGAALFTEDEEVSLSWSPTHALIFPAGRG